MSTRPANRPLPYASFESKLTQKAPDAAQPLPQPVDPVTRITDETITMLEAVEDALTTAHIQVMQHMPDTVRLKLGKLLLGTCERAQQTRVIYSLFQATGSLSAPRGGTPFKKRRIKP